MVLVEGKLSDAEIICIIKSNIPQQINERLEEGLSVLQAGNTSVNAEAALRLANNFRQTAYDAYTKQRKVIGKQSFKRKQFTESSPAKANKSRSKTNLVRKASPATSDSKSPKPPSKQPAKNSPIEARKEKKTINRYVCYNHRKYKDNARECQNVERCTYTKKAINNINQSK